MQKIKAKDILILGFLLFSGYPLYAQRDSAIFKLAELSLEELMKVQIYSASQKNESVFDAPLSSTVVTREEINRAGCSSIMEALRLVPGLIVSEQTNGNFEIHLRGLYNAPPNNLYIYSGNGTTLVMIDNRPVYNHVQGSALWETLPVDLNDVEKIEVVRGPTSVMYGANAVTGVINILTRKPEKEGWYSVANAQYGMHKTTIANFSGGYKWNDKLDAIITTNFQQRGRTQSSYFDVFRNEDIAVPDSFLVRFSANPYTTNPAERYPHPARSMYKYATNAFVNYFPREKIKFHAAYGFQNSEVQKMFAETGAFIPPLTTSSSETQYGELKSSVYGLQTHMSYRYGIQTSIEGAEGFKWDYNNFDLILNYEYKFKNFSIRPGLDFRKTIYDDRKYLEDKDTKSGTLNGAKELVNKAASLKAEQLLFNNKLRLIAGARLDRFNFPDKPYWSYQMSASFKITDNHIFRLVNSQSYRSPFLIENHIDFELAFPVSSGLFARYQILGNKELKLLSSNLIEAGYRGKMGERFLVDIELFYARYKDFNELIEQKGTIIPGQPTYVIDPFKFQNNTARINQPGVTIALNYVYKSFQARCFTTYQKTILIDYSPYPTTADALPGNLNLGNPQVYNANTGLGSSIDHDGDPDFFGGIYLNYALNSKFNFNINGYYYTAHKFYHRLNIDLRDGRGVDNLPGKILVNAKISYSPVKKLTMFISGRNIINDKAREYYRTDAIGNMYLVGFNFEF